MYSMDQTTITRHPIYPETKPSSCRNQNIHEYSPYAIIRGRNVIDIKWWNSLTAYCRTLIETRLNWNFALDSVPIPHEFQYDSSDKFLTIVYRSYIDSFDYNIWYDSDLPNGPKGVQMVQIPLIMKKVLVRMYNEHLPYIPELDALCAQINQVIDPNQTYFIRLSSTSGKNDKSIRKFSSSDIQKPAQEILSYISKIKVFVDQEFRREDKYTYLILIPWNPKIDIKFEFRIFVLDGQLTGVTQQSRSMNFQHSAEELEAIEHAINNISFIASVPYKTFVGDVYIDIDTKICHLIELNPFGPHSGAGASLFDWVDDYKRLHGMLIENPQLRYLSAINY